MDLLQLHTLMSEHGVHQGEHISTKREAIQLERKLKKRDQEEKKKEKEKMFLYITRGNTSILFLVSKIDHFVILFGNF